MPNPSRETKFSGANGDREISIFPVQLATSRIGIFTRLILSLAIYDDHEYIYIQMWCCDDEVIRDWWTIWLGVRSNIVPHDLSILLPRDN